MNLTFKKYCYGIGIIFSTFLLSVSFISAANNPAADSQFWVRLKTEPINTNGKLFMRLTTGTIAQKPNKDVYIAECIDTSDDRVCTTGTEEGDMKIYQSLENLNKMKQLYGYKFNGMLQADGKTTQKNPVKTNSNGKIPTLWFESQIQGDVVRKFYGVNIIKEIPVAQRINDLETLYSGDQGGQQQGMFKVITPTLMPTLIPVRGAAPPPPVQETCQERDNMCHCIDPPKNQSFLQKVIKILESVNPVNAVAHEEGDDFGPCDPYGRVFDAVSLEPIAGAKVTLLTKRENGNFSPMSPKETVNAIINPWTTKDDGKFTFMVLPGTYQLTVSHADFSFPFDPQKLNPNYSKAYYEIYYGKGFSEQTIIDKGVEHRDIPVVPKGEPYRAPVKLLGYQAELNKEKMIYEINGRTSHPLTIIEIMGKNVLTNQPTRSLKQVNADKWGFFQAMVSTSELKSNEVIGSVRMTKVDLTRFSQSFKDKLFDFLFKRAYAQTSFSKIPSVTSFPIHPLLNYLEGYAYDSTNKPISNAKVGVYLTGSKKPYYLTQADDKGYYVITSQHLPQMNYIISYVTPEGKTYTINQTTFLMQNIKAILANNINVNAYITKLSPFKVAAQERSVFTVQQNQINPSVKDVLTSPSTNKNLLITVIVVIIMFIIISIAIGIGVMIKLDQKKQNPAAEKQHD